MKLGQKPLQPPDSHHLSAAFGWLGLGRHAEANEELLKIDPRNAVHPDVLDALWHIHALTSQWQFCLDIANTIIRLDGQRSSGWLHSATALHELKRTKDAYNLLIPVAQRFPTEWSVPYALAYYCAQLGQFNESQLWLRKAMAIDKEAVRRKAIGDPNLQSLWVHIIGKNLLGGFTADPAIRGRTPCTGSQPSTPSKPKARASFGI